jgi:hypothetical protein
MYTQPGVLDDGDPESRKLGMEAGFAWRERADATVVYTDLGVSVGMKAGIQRAEVMHHPVETRQLGPGWEERALKTELDFKTKWP